jgi:hypothetical protein
MFSPPSQEDFLIPLRWFTGDIIPNNNDTPTSELGCYLCRVKLALLTWYSDKCGHKHVCAGCKEVHKDHLHDHECLR